MERTSGSVEACNLIIKNHDHPQHRLRPDIFIKEQYSILIVRQRAFVDKLSAKTKNTLKVNNAESDFKYSTLQLPICRFTHPSIYLYLYLSIYIMYILHMYIYIYIYTYIRKRYQKNPNPYKKNGKEDQTKECL